MNSYIKRSCVWKAIFSSSIGNNIFMFLFFALCPLLLYQPVFQNDTYWLINTGKYIANCGLPHIEPFTIHNGLNFMVQQWLSTIFFYQCYQIGGYAGVHIMIAVIYALTLFLIYRLAIRVSEGNRLICAYLTSFIGIGLYIYMVPRPQVFSLLMLIVEISLLEYFLCFPKKLWLVIVALPLLSACLINFHAAMWPVFMLLFIPYLIDGFRFEFGRIAGQKYDKKHLFLGLLLSVLAGFANPYGYRALVYLYKSYGNSSINLYVREMLSPDFKSLAGYFIFASIIAVFLMYFIVNSTTKLRYILLTIGTLYMGLSSLRSFWLFVVFGFVSLAHYLRNVHLSSAVPAKRRTISVTIAVLTMLFARVSYIRNLGTPEENHRPEEAVCYIKNNINLSKMRLFNSYITGGYIEFRGIRTFIDSRAEIFTKKLNGKEDIFKDYFETVSGRMHYSDLIAKYAFTHFLVNKDDVMNVCLKHDYRYKVIYEDKRFVLYEKIAEK